MTKILLKRAYQPASPNDGFRIYIDRLWPRGLTHEEFPYDLWDKDIAPSTELREWFHANPSERWNQFCKKYSAELNTNQAFAKLKEYIAAKPVVTLLYSSHNEEHNNAVVVGNLLQSELKSS